MGTSISKKLEPEDKGVLACQVYKLCRQAGTKVHIKQCKEWVEKVLTVSPWVAHTGLDRDRWRVIGQQMASYNKEGPSYLKDRDFVTYAAVGAALNPQPPPLLEEHSTQVGDPIMGSDSEEELEGATAYMAQMSVGAPAGFQFRSQSSAAPREPQSLLTRSLQQAVLEGEDVDWDEWSTGMFSVLVENPGQPNEVRMHRPVPFKFIKDLKEAVTKCGAGSARVQKAIATSTVAFPWTPYWYLEVSHSWSGVWVFWDSCVRL